MNKYICIIIIAIFCFSCENSNEANTQENQTTAKQEKAKKNPLEIKKELVAKGYKIIDYVDQNTKDTVLMQEYFMAFLKRGKNRSHSKKEADSLQRLHLDHLGKMYKLGYADISGPFGDLGEIRGVTIYNVPNIEMADSLANADPSVKAGRLEIEIHPWWAAKGFSLR